MNPFRVLLSVFLLTSAGAIAQSLPDPLPPMDSVVVTGTRSREAIIRHLQSVTVPGRITGKMARWENGICPVTVGLRKEAVRLINARLKEVAAQVNAPVSPSPACKPNIEIVFTTTPQALLENLRKNNSAYLGYYDNMAQRDRLAMVTRPIQAWYTTATRDLRGIEWVDSGQGGGLAFGGGVFPWAKFYNVSGLRLGEGLRNTLYHVIIVVEPGKLMEHEIGTLADYIALLALSQVQSLGTCQALPSIANLLPPGCERPAGLTLADMGYLRGLYHMNPEQALRSQQDAVALQMERAMAGQ